MAKFVVSGRADCAAYARAELLADRLKACLPDVHVHKVAVPGAEWGGWVREECERRGWVGHSGEVLVWRELVKRGGRGVYMGGVREFEEYALHYHNLPPHTEATVEERVAVENARTLEADRLEVESRPKPRPLRVTVTAASSPLAYHLLHRLAVGRVFGEQLIALHLLDTPTHADELSGIAMEITDLASPSVASVHCTTSIQEALQSASVVFILDWHNSTGSSSEEGKGEVDSDILAAASLYHKYGATLDFCAQKDVRVVVAGCYANAGAAVIVRSAPSLPPGLIIAAPCLAARQAQSAIAGKLGLNTADIEQVCVWGRCGGEDVTVDASEALVRHNPGAIVGPDTFSLPLNRCLFDADWLATGLAGEVRGRRREQAGGMSEAVAIADMVRQWWESEGQTEEESYRPWCPVGVVSDGDCYGFPVGVVCSVPVRSERGQWEVVKGLTLTPDVQAQIARQGERLSHELEMTWKHVQSQTTAAS